MSNIRNNLAHRNLREYLAKEWQVIAVLPNLDTLQLFCYRLPRFIHKLDQLMGKRVRIKQNKYGFRISLHQPDNVTLNWLAEKQEELESEPELFHLIVSRADVGLEFITVMNKELHVHLRRGYLCLNWPQRKPSKTKYEGTDYLALSQANRNLVIYSDRLSRHAGYRNRTCTRVELRLRRKAVRANDLTSIRSLISLNVIDLFEKHVRLVNERDLEEKIRKLVTNKLKQPKPNTGNILIDRYQDRGYLTHWYTCFYLRYLANHCDKMEWRSLEMWDTENIDEIDMEVDSLTTLSCTDDDWYPENSSW